MPRFLKIAVLLSCAAALGCGPATSDRVERNRTLSGNGNQCEAVPCPEGTKGYWHRHPFCVAYDTIPLVTKVDNASIQSEAELQDWLTGPLASAGKGSSGASIKYQLLAQWFAFYLNASCKNPCNGDESFVCPGTVVGCDGTPKTLSYIEHLVQNAVEGRDDTGPLPPAEAQARAEELLKFLDGANNGGDFCWCEPLTGASGQGE